ncbi:hypothetical protein OE88DRAFT_1651714 [Heliocybe sulcata]|uniref:VWFA domain-containing protein n=1 Tax=Heliocybe sulcata TaxID=5364 RepID=A0A5C3NC57_9AGAM|nr:hypothetical protein OE88DRAFT_1651714 [Heliocybe sulcata]
MGQSPSNSRHGSPTTTEFPNSSNPPSLVLVDSDGTPHSKEIRRSKSARSSLSGFLSRNSSKSDLKVDTNPFRNRKSEKAKQGSGDSFLTPDSAVSHSSSGSHRRSRSAHAAVASGQRDGLPPPPPYSPKEEKSDESSQTSLYSASPAMSPTNLEPPPGGGHSSGPRRPVRRNTLEIALQTLKKYNTVFIVDDSSSMEGKLWMEARSVLANLAHVAQKYDVDGIDVCFLNSKSRGEKLKGSASVQRLFDTMRPYGATPIGERLELLLLDYLEKLEKAKDQHEQTGDRAALTGIKPVNYIVITDGAATDDVEGPIVDAARRLDARHFPLNQVGIQFVQIGNFRQATRFLDELDDTLSAANGVRDMVDTTPYKGELTVERLTKILLGGINRRVDRKGGLSVLE